MFMMCSSEMVMYIELIESLTHKHHDQDLLDERKKDLLDMCNFTCHAGKVNKRKNVNEFVKIK